MMQIGSPGELPPLLLPTQTDSCRRALANNLPGTVWEQQTEALFNAPGGFWAFCLSESPQSIHFELENF